MIFILTIIVILKSIISLDYTASWISTGISGKAIAIGSQGDTYVIGLDYQISRYDFANNSYSKINSSIKANKITVSSLGVPYIISNKREIFYLSDNNEWVQVQGCANDISIGRGDEIWIIGCDTRKGGYGIWKYKCINLFDSLPHIIDKFKDNGRYNKEDTSNICSWFRIEGSGIKIEVDINGLPIVLTEDNSIFRYDGVNYKHISDIKAIDIAISNENVLFAVSLDHKLYILKDVLNEEWSIVAGIAKEICVGPYSQPFAINLNNLIYTTTSLGYIE